MGDPKKQHKKYSKPLKPWEKTRIEEESAIKKEFGLKNKKEIWIALSQLRNFFAQAKKSISIKTAQGEKENAQLLKRFSRLGLLSKSSSVEDILNISLKDILQRRLQSFVFSKGLAKSMNQARQFIVHGHIMVNGRKITVPGYLVLVSEENAISFSPNSGLASMEHPERATLKQMQETKEKRAKKKKGKEIKAKRRKITRKRTKR